MRCQAAALMHKVYERLELQDLSFHCTKQWSSMRKRSVPCDKFVYTKLAQDAPSFHGPYSRILFFARSLSSFDFRLVVMV